jgi:hypothetical protein
VDDGDVQLVQVMQALADALDYFEARVPVDAGLGRRVVLFGRFVPCLYTYISVSKDLEYQELQTYIRRKKLVEGSWSSAQCRSARESRVPKRLS